MTTRYVFSENDVTRQREINSRVERITGSIPTSPNRHKESPVAESGETVIPTFKIIDVSEENAPAIRIVHGSQKDTDADHTCGYVYADTNYSIPAETLGVTPQSGTTPYTYIGLKTSYDTTTKKYVFELLALSLNDWQTLINTPGIDCLQLGLLVWSDGAFRIVQSLNIWNYDLRAKYWV